VPAARVVFDCGAPVVMVPCMGVASHLHTSLSEIRDYVKDVGPIGEYLHETYKNCAKDHFGYTRVIWDISTIAWLVNPNWAPSHLAPSPRISDDGHWIQDPTRHPIRYVYHLHRDAIFKDLFRKIGARPE
jgi:inosine-uridine nucleoside N-ribohydrolase